MSRATTMSRATSRSSLERSTPRRDRRARVRRPRASHRIDRARTTASRGARVVARSARIHRSMRFDSTRRARAPHSTTRRRRMATRRALRPLMDRVLVERIAPATKSVGGVLLPESMTGKTVRRRRGRRLAKDGRRRRARACMNECMNE